MLDPSNSSSDSPPGASIRDTLRNSWMGLSPNVRGAGFVTGGAFVLIIMASVIKELGKTLPVFEILFVRFLVGLLVLVFVVWRTGFGQLHTKKPHYHLLRGFVGFMGNLCFVFALVNMAIADTVTIQFSRPLITAVIAVLFLGEIIGWRRGIATAVGFAGVLMITRPFGEGFEPWALVALSGTVFATLVVLMIKLLSRTESTLVIMFYFALFTTLFAFIPAVIVWQTPTGTELALLVLCGVLGVIGQSLFTHGIGLGETSFVMPFDYLRIVFSFIVGFIWFSEIPGIWSFAGAAVIIASSLYLLRGKGNVTLSGDKG
jgi:drug/metabolite transporter (DMT)-like permease